MSRRRRRSISAYLRRALGLAAVVLGLAPTALAEPAVRAHAPTAKPSSVSLIRAASQDALAFWRVHGVEPYCPASLHITRLDRDTAAEARWWIHEDGSYFDCEIHVARDFMTYVNEPGLDRFERRRRLVDLWDTMAHEWGHMAGMDHHHGGLMSAYIEDISPPAEAIEWAIKLTPRRK